MPIEVVCRFTGTWVSGFEVADTRLEGSARIVRRLSGRVRSTRFSSATTMCASDGGSPMQRNRATGRHAHAGADDSCVVVPVARHIRYRNR